MKRRTIILIGLVGLAVFATQCSKVQPVAPPTAPSTKDELVTQLVDLTFESHPVVPVGGKLPEKKNDPDMDKLLKQNTINIVKRSLANNKGLTSEQKAFVKSNLDELGAMLDKKLADLMAKTYDTSKWVREALQTEFAKKYEAPEMEQLIAQFKTDAGKQTLKHIRVVESSRQLGEGAVTPQFTDQEKQEYEKFAATEAGKKFLQIFIKDTEPVLDENMKTAYSNSWVETFSIVDDVEVNKMIDQFVAERFKK
jgi:hypothetical protein